MVRGFIDIRADEIRKALQSTDKKKRVCKVLPSSRFNIGIDGNIYFNGLVCCPEDGMDGKATGVGAQYCENCKSRKSKK